MGTTRTAFTTDAGVELCFCLLIEGYDNVITSYADTSAVVDAYQATEWDAAIAGLHVPEGMTERMELFTGKIDAPSARFVVSPDSADTFGLAVHKTADPTGDETRLSSSVTNKTQPIPVDSTAGFASSGTIYIGTERIDYSGLVAGIGSTTCKRGMYAPFKAYDETEQRFGRPHNVAVVDGVSRPPRVTSYPRIWAGKVVRCLVHRIRGGVLDAFGEAETVFAGLLEHVGDSEAGNTVLDCVHYNRYISDRILLADQYRAKVRPGLFLSAGDGTDATTAMFFEAVDETDIGGGARVTYAEALTVVSGAAADATEVTEGWYTYSQLLDIVNAFTLYHYNAGSLNSRIELDRYAATDGTLTRIRADGVTLGSNGILKVGFFGSLRWRKFMGMGNEEVYESKVASTTPTIEAYSSSVPLRSVAFQSGVSFRNDDAATLAYTRLEAVNVTGSWVTVQTADLPDTFSFSSGDWGYLQVGDVLISGKYDSGNERFTDLAIPSEVVSSFLGVGNKSKTAEDLEFYGVTTVDDSGDVEIRQVVVMQNELGWLFSKIFYSTGSKLDYNDIQIDVLDEQMGLGVPYELLETSATSLAFKHALFSLQAASEAGDITLVIDKPTKFGEILKPELLLRGASLVIDDGQLKIATFNTPGRTPDHTVTAASKATGGRTNDPNRSKTNRTTRLLRDKITVEYNRSLDDKYRSQATVVNLATMSDHAGYARPIKIKARNSVGGDKAQGAIIQSQLSELASYALGLFGHEVTEVTTSISRKHFDIQVGETVALTDGSIRNPLTGVRGITAYPCWVEEVSKDWHAGIGEVKLILLGLDDSSRYGIYSPAAELSAYDTGTGVATLLPNRYTLSGDTDVSHYAAGDAVRFIEVSPSDPSSPSTFVDVIDSISSNDITTVSNNGSGTYNSALTYAMVSDDRATAASTQQTDAYQADDADGLVQNAVASYLWARENLILNLIYSLNTGSLHLERSSAQYLLISDAAQSGLEGFTTFTAEADVRLESISTHQYLVAKYNLATGQRTFYLRYANGGVWRFDFDGAAGNDAIENSHTLELCRWYHVAVTFDAGTVKMFVDGAQIGSTQVSTTVDLKNSAANFTIGRRDNNSAYWDGDVDNVRIWNVARTPAQIKNERFHELFGNETGLVSYWPLNSDFLDRTSTGNDLTGYGGAATTTEVPWVLASEPHRYPANLADAEGEPVSPFIHTNAIQTLNNLVSYKTAPQCSWWVGDTESSNWEYRYTSSDSDAWELVSIFPFALGVGRLAAGDRFTRKMAVSPAFYRASGAGTITLRVTFMRDLPFGTAFSDVVFREPYQQLEFSTSSSSLTIPCLQSVTPPTAYWPGSTFCAVELQADNTEVAVFAGFPIWFYGPLSP